MPCNFSHHAHLWGQLIGWHAPQEGEGCAWHPWWQGQHVARATNGFRHRRRQQRRWCTRGRACRRRRGLPTQLEVLHHAPLLRRAGWDAQGSFELLRQSAAAAVGLKVVRDRWVERIAL